MRRGSRWGRWNPLHIFPSRFDYSALPAWAESTPISPYLRKRLSWQRTDKWRLAGRTSRLVVMALALAFLVLFAILLGGWRSRHEPPGNRDEPLLYGWQQYARLDGFYNGIRTITPFSEYVPGNRYNTSEPPLAIIKQNKTAFPTHPSMRPVRFDPYPEYSSPSYLRDHDQVHTCYLDPADKVAVPDVHAYPGLPPDIPEPFYGSFDAIGLDDKMCFDRFGRLGPYGYGYNTSQGGLSVGEKSEHVGSDEIFNKIGYTNYTGVNWGEAQRRCYEKNKDRFEERSSHSSKKRISRQVYLLRTWTGYKYTDYQLLTLRAMISELNLKSGGEYDVHFLVHVKNNSLPIWADADLYRETIESNVPREFWNMSTLWSEKQMEMYYPGPFKGNFVNMVEDTLHGVYRTPHFALQWFSHQHPEYDFVWNWEMDLRYTGHYYEFHNKIHEWGKNQPRKGMWERSRRFYISALHGDWANFTQFVEKETAEVDVPKNNVEQSGPMPVWGPVDKFPSRTRIPSRNNTHPPTTYEKDDYTWGVGEDADLLTFNPIFDPSLTNWVFNLDASGYDLNLPPPPRRAAIITVARLSKRLLATMHEETWRLKHTMFPEMWPASAALHHGMKALAVPHPVYFDRDWNLDYLDGAFNRPREIWESPFGWGEHNFLGSSFYYNSQFSGALWRRWLGMRENGEGGRREEERFTGRMCLRGQLHHPVKHESGPVD